MLFLKVYCYHSIEKKLRALFYLYPVQKGNMSIFLIYYLMKNLSKMNPVIFAVRIKPTRNPRKIRF